MTLRVGGDKEMMSRTASVTGARTRLRREWTKSGTELTSMPSFLNLEKILLEPLLIVLF